MNWTTGTNQCWISEQVEQSQGLCFFPRDIQHIPAPCTWGAAPPCRALAPSACSCTVPSHHSPRNQLQLQVLLSPSLAKHWDSSEGGICTLINSFPTTLSVGEARHHPSPTSPSFPLLTPVLPSQHPLPQPWSSSSLAQLILLHPEECSKPPLNSKLFAFHTSAQLGLAAPYPSICRAATSRGDLKGKKKERGCQVHTFLIIPTNGPGCISIPLLTASWSAHLCCTDLPPAELIILFINLHALGTGSSSKKTPLWAKLWAKGRV